MKHVGILKRDTWVKIINYVGFPSVGVYLICMIFVPSITSGGDWEYIQLVWGRWQSLNVGMIAFTSSIVAFSISIYNEKEQRERNFVAAKAFLPAALSELTVYFKFSGLLLVEAWNQTVHRNSGESINKSPLQNQVPDQPASISEIFRRCIEFAEPDVGNKLAYLLMCLQIHHSRMELIKNNFQNNNDRLIIVSRTIITYLRYLAELQAETNRLFNLARFDMYDDSVLTLSEFQSAYLNLEIDIDLIDGLSEYTKNNIGKKLLKNPQEFASS